MNFLNEDDIINIGINWKETINTIENTISCLAENDFAQPIKPYLRYRDLSNRIIAMPAFLGGNFNIAGIKWIASFPKNINKGIPRAHSVLILNNADTGEPVSIINTALLSIIRTASVSGLILKKFIEHKNYNNIKLGIIGFGPIGQYHLKMCSDILGNNLSQICLFDIKKVEIEKIDEKLLNKIKICENWQEAYTDSDIFITCTVSKEPYIDQKPKSGSLHLNVSLRDYKPDVYDWFKNSIIVDDWEEVCREKTDIEIMHKTKNLQKEDTLSIIDVIQNNSFVKFNDQDSVLFNPMGMAVFDLAIGWYYLSKTIKQNIKE